MSENMDLLNKLRRAFQPTLNNTERLSNAEDFYWFYRMAKENSQALEIAFLREGNRLQKIVIDDLLKEVEKDDE